MLIQVSTNWEQATTKEKIQVLHQDNAIFVLFDKTESKYYIPSVLRRSYFTRNENEDWKQTTLDIHGADAEIFVIEI